MLNFKSYRRVVAVPAHSPSFDVFLYDHGTNFYPLSKHTGGDDAP